MEYQRNIRQNGEEYVTAFAPELDSPLVATDQHPNYEAIIEALQDGAPASEVEALVDLSVAVARSFENLTERVAVANGRVYFDGDELHEAVTDHIVRALDADDESTAVSLARFLEKLAANPSARSREQLYDWLQTAEFTIDQDGDLIAYKGVTGDLLSINSGKAIVDGELHEDGRVPNECGSVIEFPRSEVLDDAAVGCARGLHVGTWGYASSFAQGAILKVAVNPRDVVSVPTDCSAQKVRVCRYQVLDVIEEPVSAPIDTAEEPEDDDRLVWEVKFQGSNGHWLSWTPAEPIYADSAYDAYEQLVADAAVAETEFKQAVRWVEDGQRGGWCVFSTSGAYEGVIQSL